MNVQECSGPAKYECLGRMHGEGGLDVIVVTDTSLEGKW